jgi:hypothetical protein
MIVTQQQYLSIGSSAFFLNALRAVLTLSQPYAALSGLKQSMGMPDLDVR